MCRRRSSRRSPPAVFGGHSLLFYYLQIVTALILVLAANTAFNGFPVLACILSQSSFLPRQLRNRGDRLIFSNGVLLLAGFALVLIVAFGASSTRLIQLYIVGRLRQLRLQPDRHDPTLEPAAAQRDRRRQTAPR